MWVLEQLNPGSVAYNVPFFIDLVGDLDVPCLANALRELCARHEILRTRFALGDDGQARQVPYDEPMDVLDVVDLCGTNDTAEKLEGITAAFTGAPFDLQRGPLLRVKLIRMSGDVNRLFFVIHHIIFDASSFLVLTRELALLYNSLLVGKPNPLEPLAIQYADFSLWQRQWVNGDFLKAQLDYWQEYLAGAPTVLELPTDFPRRHGAERPVAGDHVIHIENSAVLAASQLVQRQGGTLYTLLMATYGLVLSRYSGQSDILIGSAIANRSRSELEGLIGFFANHIVLRAKPNDNLTVAEYLQDVVLGAFGAQEHQDAPFAQIVESLRPERHPGRNPVFQVGLTLQNVASLGGGCR
jgi:hypothetical protein